MVGWFGYRHQTAGMNEETNNPSLRSLVLDEQHEVKLLAGSVL